MLGAGDELDLDLGVARERDLVAAVDVAEVDGLGQRVHAEAGDDVLVVGEGDEAGDETEAVGADNRLANTAVVVMTDRGRVGEEKRSEDFALIGIGFDVALFVDGQIFGLGARGAGDVAVDVLGARFIGQAVETEAQLAVAAEPARSGESA